MGGSLRPGLAVALVLFVACCLLPARAEVFHFENMPIPEPYSMTTQHVFYVYSKEDAPRRQESASVVFRNLGANPTGNNRLHGYDSLQISLLPLGEMWDLVDKFNLCSNRDDVNSHLALKAGRLLLRQTPAASRALVRTVPLPAAPQNVEFQVKKTGRYVLAYSNCGNASTTSATVTGSVLVKNPYGFLPGNEYSNLNFHGWCAVIYVVLNVLWTGMYVRFFRSTFYIQTGIAGISALCLLESSFSWLMYKDWNSTGSLDEFFVLLSTVTQVLKYVCSWRLLQLSFLGIGQKPDDVDTVTAVKMNVASVLFVIQLCVWKLVMRDRYSLQLQSGFVLAVALPGFFIYAALFHWSFLTLAGLLNRLKEEQKEMALACFQKVQRVLIAAVAGSCLVVTLQAVEISIQEAVPWNLQFLVSSGAADLVFMAALAAMMLVWLPREDSWKLTYMPQATVDADEDGARRVESAEAADGPPGGLEGEDGSFASAVAPEPIGARGGEERPEGEAESAVLL